MEEQKRRDQDAFQMLERAGIDVSGIGSKKQTTVQENETLLQRLREDRVVQGRDNYGYSNPVVSILTNVFIVVVALACLTLLLGIVFAQIIFGSIKSIGKVWPFKKSAER